MALGITSIRRCTAISIRRARGRSVRSSTAPNSPAITSSRFATMKAAEKLLAGPDLVVDGLARSSAAISIVEASESNELEDSERGELQGILKTFTLPVVFYAPQPGTQPLAIEEMQQLFHDFIHDCEKTLDPDMLNAAKPHLEERLTTFRDELKAHQLGREGTARPDGELDRVFPKAEAPMQKIQLRVRYKDVTFETSNLDDF